MYIAYWKRAKSLPLNNVVTVIHASIQNIIISQILKAEYKASTNVLLRTYYFTANTDSEYKLMNDSTCTTLGNTCVGNM